MVSLMNWLQNWGALSISIISLIIAVISLIQAGRAQSLQNKVNELELQIKQNEIDRIEKERAMAQNSCVEARVINMGNGKYRLKVWNSGNTTVTHVSASIEEANGPIILVDDKQPYDELEPKKNYELTLIVHMGTARKFHVITEWIDSEGCNQSKRQMADL